ncbi:hypothetical protein [Cupriavidus metallidurans]|uniref:hypothetical protein n=1 Tax=Cupriavidus metallidurans TaxID=119219 RepID=UPI000CE05FE7|nr:hypothetical protein [Cupriavidus metallidurans]AVA36285.1 hypothetical protein C3Z06_23515 [Cupriavidus metallidurans]
MSKVAPVADAAGSSWGCIRLSDSDRFALAGEFFSRRSVAADSGLWEAVQRFNTTKERSMERGAIVVAIAALVGGFAWSPMASAAGPGVIRSTGCDASGVADSSCLGMPAEQRAAGGLVRRGDSVSNATIGCTQGAADSACAVKVGSLPAAYNQPSSGIGATACANYAPNVWQNACPAGYQGAITLRQDYSCPVRSIVSIGGAVSQAPMEPGAWGSAYQVASSCEPIQPPAPARSVWVATLYPGPGADVVAFPYLGSRTLRFCSANKPRVYQALVPASIIKRVGDTLQLGNPPPELGFGFVSMSPGCVAGDLKQCYRDGGNVTDYWFSWGREAGSCSAPATLTPLDPAYYDVD